MWICANGVWKINATIFFGQTFPMLFRKNAECQPAGRISNQIINIAIVDVYVDFIVFNSALIMEKNALIYTIKSTYTSIIAMLMIWFYIRPAG